MDNFEVRAVIKYLRLKGLSPHQVHDDLVQTLGASAPSYSTVKKWHREFSCGRSSCEDQHRSGRPSTAVTQENIEAVEKLIKNDRRYTTRAIADVVGISNGSIESILSDHLGLRKVSCRWVPRMLTDEQKHCRSEYAAENLALLEQDPENFWRRIVTMDETWVHHFDPETKQQSMVWKHSSSPTPKKFRVQASAGKVMASVFWDEEGILLIDYLDHGSTITGTYYANLIGRLVEAIKEKRRGKMRRGVLFLHDNAPSHKSHVATAAIGKAKFELLKHPPYSPDLAPSDYYLFPKLKEYLRGKKFEGDDDVIQAASDWFEGQDKDFYATGIRKLEKRWRKCVDLNGDYIEK